MHSCYFTGGEVGVDRYKISRDYDIVRKEIKLVMKYLSIEEIQLIAQVTWDYGWKKSTKYFKYFDSFKGMGKFTQIGTAHCITVISIWNKYGNPSSKPQKGCLHLI